MSIPTFTPRGGNPYPPARFDNSREAVERLAEATSSWPRPAVEPHYPSVAALMDDRAAAATAPPLDKRVPGAALNRLMGVAAEPAVPAAAPVPEPPAAEPFPGWLRDFLLTFANDAAIGVSAQIARDGAVPDILERGGRYARLFELLQGAPDSGSAVRTLLAEGWR